MRCRRFKASRMRETAACIWGSKNGSLSELSRGRRNAFTSSAQRNPFRKSNRAMHSDPQIWFHEIALPFSSSGGARIHRSCRVKLPVGFASIELPSTRCCTDQFIRGKISDKMQRGAVNLTIHQDWDKNSTNNNKLNEIPLVRTRLRFSFIDLRSLAVLFILAIHGSTSFWRQRGAEFTHGFSRYSSIAKETACCAVHPGNDRSQVVGQPWPNTD